MGHPLFHIFLLPGKGVFHYKSPRDALNKAEYELALAYLYCSYTGASSKEVTLSFIREGKPHKLIACLAGEGFDVELYESGIYHVKKTGFSTMQIIVAKELKDEYIWLKALTRNLTKENAEKLANEAKKRKDGTEQEIENLKKNPGKIAML